MAAREEHEAFAAKQFAAIGLAESTAKEVAKNRKTREELLSVIEEAGAQEGCPKAVGVHLYQISTKYPLNARDHRKAFLVDYIMSEKIKASNQLAGALEYLSKIGSEAVNQADLEEASGVGVEVTHEQLAAAVKEVIESEADLLREERYQAKPGPLLAGVKSRLKWADGAAVKAEIEAQLAAFLGPKTEADLKPIDKKAKKKKTQEKVKAAAAAADGAVPGPGIPATANGHAARPGQAAENGAASVDDAATSSPFTFLPAPEDNNKVHTVVNFSDGNIMEIRNTADQLQKHLARTGRRVITRFPPEPNGYLHIGHAKAMFVSFGMAAEGNGDCFLRFDDTNPEAEKLEYIEHIQDIVSWMGWKPYKITYSSDYFTELYQFAVQLIKRGCAYVDHQTADEIKQYREERMASPWRDRPIQESLRIFEEMRRGMVNEGKATLRMKQDVKNENYNMFDLIAYRVKFMPHPHAGTGWCIYPSYDFTHCLVDVLEDVTHSLCTLEFESRRASYFWLLEVLDCYKPVVWEYARLNITNNVLSKRKLNRLAYGGIIRGWDDPRLLTLAGLRRRGVTATAINSFCRELGITRAESAVHLHKLDYHIRLDLDANSPRCLAVLRPLRVVLTNLPEDHHTIYDAKVFPSRMEETYPVVLTRVIYIEETDFRDHDSKDYYGLAPGKSILLKYAGAITCEDFSVSDGRVTEVRASFSPIKEGTKPPKGVLNWVGQPAAGQEPFKFEARLYAELFKSLDPSDLGDNWMEDLNPDSEVIVKGAFACTQLSKAKHGDRFQLERLGYFCVDSDSTSDSLVINRTCTLRESVATKAVKT